MPTKEELKMLQALPLEIKLQKTQQRIHEWVRHYGEDSVYVAFSGGKDSTVLLDIVRKIYSDIEAVFIDTGLEYPEIRKFVKKFENITIIRPKIRFDEVIKKYGYPVISKDVSACVAEARISASHGKIGYKMKRLRGEAVDNFGRKSQFNLEKWLPLLTMDFQISDRCCKFMKKEPSNKFNKLRSKVPITAQTADESRLRRQQWLRFGCNGFAKKAPMSNPMGFWKEQDVLRYVIENKLEIASVYGTIVSDEKQSEKLKCTGCQRTGCVFCAFGAHLGKGESRFERLKTTHPKLYEYCLQGGAYDAEDGLWKPDNRGLGMQHVFDEINKIYGQKFIRY